MSSPKKIKHILQNDECGCVVACMAMVLGKSYDQVKQDFQHTFETDGIVVEAMLDYLGDHGCSIVLKAISHFNDKDFAREEMVRPFADVHIVIVRMKFDSKWTHAVVMTKEGEFLCPGGYTDAEIRNAYLIKEAYGIHR